MSPLVRSSALDGLTDIMLALPDVYVQVRWYCFASWLWVGCGWELKKLDVLTLHASSFNPVRASGGKMDE